MGAEFRPKKIAIVGSGVSGLGALYALKGSGHEVHLFERNSRLGGHTNTVEWIDEKRDVRCQVDTGFIVMNTSTYPNFLNFLRQMKIKPVPTQMTFSISRNFGEYEWSGDAPFCQLSNLFSPSHWRMLFDYLRFNAFATDILRDVDSDKNTITLGAYLDLHNYSAAFRNNYLLPLTGCVWSMGPEKCALDFPAVTLIRFMMNHNLLFTLTKRPDWLTIKGGSQQYIDALLSDFPASNIHTDHELSSIQNHGPDSPNKLSLFFNNTSAVSAYHFDEVILATHGDTAFSILQPSLTATEESILSAFQTTLNIAYLHSDRTLLPVHHSAWSSWNYLSTSTSTTSSSPCTTTATNNASEVVSLTYNMNTLQHIPTATYSDILVSLNPPIPPHPSTLHATIPYRHPVYTTAAVAAQAQLSQIQGTRHIWYAGAWTGYGFHEDGFTSGLVVARELGGSVPWQVVDLRRERNVMPLGIGEQLGRVVILIVLGLIYGVELLGALAEGLYGRLFGGKVQAGRVVIEKKKIK